ncbi:amidohydrolase [Klebsiella pneumoniae]|uniref:Amidohydrolase n=1 Tax=Klebsiella pneumoniae TaxID=573 RepID=A0A2X3D0F1_KLEPN|nr:amidohydrolase [Klebsiella pneumoniae]
MVREGLFDDVDAALTWHPEAWAGMFSTAPLTTFRRHGDLPAPRPTPLIRRTWAGARWMPSP